MAEKAVIDGMVSVENAVGGWTLTFLVHVSDASMVPPATPPYCRDVLVPLFMTTMNPDVSYFRKAIAAEVGVQALAQYALTVDTVTFPDFGVVGLPLL